MLLVPCIYEFLHYYSSVYKYEGYLESNLQQAVNKTSNEKKNTYILKLLLNIVTARMEALVASENKFLYACVKEVCCM
jgi:hypothetical protein